MPSDLNQNLAPGGPVDAAQVHRIAKRQSLILTPGGFRHPSLVHHVDCDHEVHHSATSKRLRNMRTNEFRILKEEMVLPGEVPAFGRGWICYTFWMNETGSPITAFKTSWEVPPEPTTQGQQTIFLFNGIDPMNVSSSILQPVLQWGRSGAGGGPFWSISSWYVAGDGHAYHTDLMRVDVGERLVGLISLADSQDGTFSYVCEFEGVAGTRLPVQNVPELKWCNETLEAYNISQCSDYPATSKTTFSDISVHTKTGPASVTWSNATIVSECGQAAVVNASGTVDLRYA
ncbi:hypothetical protein [Chromobacterium vaccinii]|uniref:hypothetical protein n=1 Tax=Chromobacterium vaccinii TaxID=1108595 RepID=UPI0006181D98|nr:hypothetical protein [Chromobacterium vaccinii]